MLARLAIAFAILATLVTAARPATAQYEWTPYENNPVIAWNFDATSTYLFRPTVIKREGRYHMWYGKQIGLLQGPHTRSVGYAVSENGIEWDLENPFSLEPSQVLGTFDEVYAYSPTVVDDGDTLHMWYAGGGRLADGLGYAWSIDGSTWTKVRGSGQGGSVFDTSMDPVAVDVVVSPTVVKKDEIYHLWYQKLVSSDGLARIGYARSSDGQNWTVIPGFGAAQSVLDVGNPNTFDEDQIWWPWVIYNEEKGIFEMWYQGIDSPAFGGVPRLGCARSTDGITWEKVAGSGEAGACSNSRAQPGVILDEGIYKMWYSLTTNASPRNDEIGYAVSDPTPTAVDPQEVPNSLTIAEVFPNPFVTSVQVRFESTKPSTLTLRVIDLLGRDIFVERLPLPFVGVGSVQWDGRKDDGTKAPSGSYVIGIEDNSRGISEYQIVHLLR